MSYVYTYDSITPETRSIVKQHRTVCCCSLRAEGLVGAAHNLFPDGMHFAIHPLLNTLLITATPQTHNTLFIHFEANAMKLLCAFKALNQ